MKAWQGFWAAVFLLIAVTASCTTILGIDHEYKEVDAGLPCADPSMCDDQDPCSTDTCENGLCVHAAVPDGDAPRQLSGDCQALKCVGGVGESVIDLTDIASDNNDCTLDTCDANGMPRYTTASAGMGCTLGGQTGLCDAFGGCLIICGPGKAACDDLNPCTTDLCDPSLSKCTYTSLPDGTPTPGVMQAAGDCRIHQCIMGVDTDVTDDTDLPVTQSDCVIPTCTMGVPSTPSKGTGTGCSTSGGKVCDGNGACVQCNVTAECSGTMDECQHPACTNHLCGPVYTPVNTPVSGGLQMPGDCQLVVCDGSGGTKGNADDADIGFDGNPCTDDICMSGVSSHPPKAAGFACGVGLVCDGMGSCVGCFSDAQCNAPQTCNPPGCGMPNKCACCPKTCAQIGATCGTVSDTCGGSIGCNNNTKDGAETDVDCGGGGGCATKCGLGKKCAVNSDCNSTFCVEGVCCNNACSGGCQSCLAVNKVSGSDGGCGNIKGGVDPKNSCPDQGLASCGLDGSCDGGGACRYYATGSVCAAASCANATTLNKADTCSAAHMCFDNGIQGCGNYICENSACRTTCASNADCATSAFYCAAPNCVAKKPNGNACSAGVECVSDNCVDGRCCNTACGSACQSCSVAGNLGTCTNIPAGGTDNNPPGSCVGPAMLCDGAGSCKKVNGQTCATSGECQSGSCVDGYCCNNGCGGTCQSCGVPGSLGTCVNIPAGGADNNPPGICSAPNQCSGMGICLLSQGSVCSFTFDCVMGLSCTDGVCCNSTCAATCMSCNVPGSVGVCTNVPLYSADINPICGGGGDPAHTCNGAGACRLATGQACGMNSECASGVCLMPQLLCQ